MSLELKFTQIIHAFLPGHRDTDVSILATTLAQTARNHKDTSEPKVTVHEGFRSTDSSRTRSGTTVVMPTHDGSRPSPSPALGRSTTDVPRRVGRVTRQESAPVITVPANDDQGRESVPVDSSSHGIDTTDFGRQYDVQIMGADVRFKEPSKTGFY